MKFIKDYMFGGLSGKEDSTDYVVGYQCENGKYIEKVELMNCSEYYYECDGYTFNTLKEAKQYCEGIAKKEAEKETEKKTYTDIWNEAYDILKEQGRDAMMTYVYGQRDSGSLTEGDVSILIEDMRDCMVEVVDGRNAKGNAMKKIETFGVHEVWGDDKGNTVIISENSTGRRYSVDTRKAGEKSKTVATRCNYDKAMQIAREFLETEEEEVVEKTITVFCGYDENGCPVFDTVQGVPEAN